MEELIKTNLLSYAFLTAFSGYFLLIIIHGTFKKAKDNESKKIKTVLRFGADGVLVCFWIWFFVYTNLFPISLAYYEYNHNSVEEKIGVIESIEFIDKNYFLVGVQYHPELMQDNLIFEKIIEEAMKRKNNN